MQLSNENVEGEDLFWGENGKEVASLGKALHRRNNLHIVVEMGKIFGLITIKADWSLGMRDYSLE